MVNRTGKEDKEMHDLIGKWAQKGIIRRVSEEQAAEETRPAKLGVKELWGHYRNRYQQVTGHGYAWSMKNQVLLTRMIKELGNDTAKAVIDYVLENSARIKELKNSAPTLPFIYGFRHTMLARMTKKEITSETKEGKDYGSW